MKAADPKSTAGRAFVRSLNILLKFARLYGYDHARTVEQLDVAFRELQTAIPAGTETGLLLGASGSQLLLDGVPLEGSPAEKQFAQLLSSAGLASVQFFPSISQEELARFAHAFPTGKAKPSELAEQLKRELSGAQGIRINEICFVATDARLKDASVAAQLAAATLGDDQEQFKQWLNDPQKLLEMIAAAQGAKGGGAGGSGSPRDAQPSDRGGASDSQSQGTSKSGSNGNAVSTTGVGSGPVSQSGGDSFTGGYSSDSLAEMLLGSGVHVRAGAEPPSTTRRGLSGDASEEEIYGILSALTSIGQIGAGGVNAAAAAGAFHEQMSQLPGRAQDTLKAALAELASRAPDARPDESTLVRLAEHLAIKFAIERYENGEVQVNAVRQMLDRMNGEIESLRKILGSHEDKMTEAGMVVETHREILDRQFWAAVPESGKRTVLLSGEAWCIPPRNVQSYVAELIEQGEIADAISILQNYASCADNAETDARKKAAAGISQMAELYAQIDPRLLGDALRHLGVRLNVEPDAELQGLVSAAFVRLTQEAAAKRCFPAMEQALELVSGVEGQRPGIARALRDKMGIEDRVPEFVEEALRARQAAAGLTGVLKLLPQTAMEQLAIRFNRCALREDSENVANLAADLGEEGIQCLRSTVRGGLVAEAVEAIGLLSKLDLQSLAIFLPSRMKDFPPASQDRAIRQISSAAAPGRCRIFLELIDHLNPLVMPLAIDEIGVTSDREALPRLLTVIDGDLPPGGASYLRVKAVEALGRIQAPESTAALKRIVEAKKIFGWAEPQELRIAAIQALEKLDPAWAIAFLPKSGLDEADLALAPLDLVPNSKFVRQRRHGRVRLNKPVTAISTNLKEACRLEIKTASLSGGLATISRHLAPGTQVQLRLQLGLRNVVATAMMRDYRAQDMAFEIVDITLDERTKLRRLLSDSLCSTPPAAPSDAATQDASPLVPAPRR
jgi:hypothetical protein